jgi:hypothetical protein
METGEYVYGIEEENVRKNIGIIGGFFIARDSGSSLSLAKSGMVEER